MHTATGATLHLGCRRRNRPLQVDRAVRGILFATVAASRKVIEELAAQIQSLPRKEQVSVLERVLTPHLELEVALMRWHGRARRHGAREITRTVNHVANEVRRGRGSSRRP